MTDGKVYGTKKAYLWQLVQMALQLNRDIRQWKLRLRNNFLSIPFPILLEYLYSVQYQPWIGSLIDQSEWRKTDQWEGEMNWFPSSGGDLIDLNWIVCSRAGSALLIFSWLDVMTHYYFWILRNRISSKNFRRVVTHIHHSWIFREILKMSAQNAANVVHVRNLEQERVLKC